MKGAVICVSGDYHFDRNGDIIAVDAVGCQTTTATSIFLDIVCLINYKYKAGPEPNCGTDIGTVTDIDGNMYLTVKICDQWWMMENLK